MANMFQKEYKNELGGNWLKRKKIIYLRVDNGLNQKEFGEMLGVTGQSISLIENGRSNGSPKFWYKLKTTFHIPDEQMESYRNLY